MEAIQRTWGQAHYQLNETQIIVVKPPNGGKSVYERIKGAIGEEFVALIVRFTHFHGRHNSDLWEWLDQEAKCLWSAAEVHPRGPSRHSD